MARSSKGRKGRAIVGLLGLAPAKYLSPARIAEVVGCSRSRVSDALCALAESPAPADKNLALVYRATARRIGGEHA